MPKLFSEETRYRLAMLTKFVSFWIPVLALVIGYAGGTGVTVREIAAACSVALPGSWAVWAAYISESPSSREDRLARESRDLPINGGNHGDDGSQN